MAYNRRYNPDALPAFAEPESNKPKRDPYETKPVPPPPVANVRGDDRYRPTSPATYVASPTAATPRDDRYAPGPASRPPRGSSYEDYDRRYPRPADPDPRRRTDSYGSSSRYDQRPAPPQVPPTPRLGDERDALWPMFRVVDKDGSGQLSEKELGAALVNGDYTSFDPHTVKMMIRMFDVDRSGTISFDEFCGLWGFLSEWRKLFDKFDVDRSGTIEFEEFQDALVAFGYRLSPNYVRLLFNTYDVRGKGVLSFDLFVQACISLKRMTDVFKKYDTDRDGYITLSFEEFLTGSQALFLFNSISPSTDKGLY